MMPKPTVLPEWAMEDKQNGITGQWNVVDPPAEKKLAGWNYLEKPNRQYWNWFQRQTSLWIAYFNENLNLESSLLVPTWTGLTNQPSTNQFYYSRLGDKCFFSIHIIWAGNVDPSSLIMTNLPFTAKNIPNFLQSIHVTRGAGPNVIPNGQVLSAIIDPNTTNLRVWQEDLASGAGTPAVASLDGQLVISGSYFIQPIP